MLSIKKSRPVENSSATKLVLQNSVSSHIVIAANDDLLIEILIRLPIKSLIRFKSVSKHWLSIITNPRFCHRKNHSFFSKAIYGLFLHRSSFLINPEYDFVPLGLDLLGKQPVTLTPPFKTLTFVKDQRGIKVTQSCNGLLLCCSFRAQNPNECKHYLFNPTTKQFATIPESSDRVSKSTGGVKYVYGVNLAFDPRKSPNYKLICVCFSNSLEDHFELEVYSSETGLWKQVGDPFQAEINVSIGVYWNDAINWISYWNDGLYFKVDEERLGTMPMPPLPDGWEEEGRRIRYFGESNDHLHLIEIYGPRTIEFNVYEMDKEYSGWYVKFHVDLELVVGSFPECICNEIDPSSLHYYEFLILDVVRKNDDDDDESFIVLSIPGKAVRLNFGDKSFKKLCDFSPNHEFGFSPMYGWYNSFQFIQSLYPL